MSENSRYNDIIHLSRPVSHRYPSMNRSDRAAQFSPFAALTGYEEAVEEASRLTDSLQDADDGVKEKINAKLQFLSDHLESNAVVDMTVFCPDERKPGGSHIHISGIIHRIDPISQTVLLINGLKIRMEHICTMESDMFPDYLE